MLPGFEEITAELTTYERETLLPIMLSGLSKKVGEAKAITNKEIRSHLAGKYKVSDVGIRKLINHIRRHNLLPGLVATSKGYYLTTDKAELQRYIGSLAGRENEIRKIKESTQAFLKSL